jgi:Flp pilus assembly protein TadB
LDEEEQEKIKNIVNDINRDVQKSDQEAQPSFQGYSRKYQEYKEEAEEDRKLNRYEKLCYKSASILSIKADESVRDDLVAPIKLLGWEITPGMVLSASLMVGISSFFLWGFTFILNSMLGILPGTIMLLSVSLCFGSAAYTYYKPVFDAKNKVINSSGEMILSILYMVLYMRSSPNLEGAIRFAALNLDGPISKDLKKVLWDVEVGNYNRIEQSLENYTEAWKDYNEDYLESMQLLKAAVNEKDPSRREDLLETSVQRILDGTQEKMKHYAQGLKTPVMILNAMGAMLPVMAMIILPLVSVFMGGAISATDLVITFNIFLPIFLYIFMQKVLSSRPPTVSSEPIKESSLPKRGYYPLEIGERTVNIPTKLIGFSVFFIIASYGIFGYLAFPHTFPLGDKFTENPGLIPELYRNGVKAAPLPMLLRSISITFGLGIGIGISKILGNKKRKEAEKELSKIESQFPNALFELGNKISGGTPVELALDKAAESTSDLEISNLFRKSSYNIQKMGMTFEDSIFDEKNGAINAFPSQMIQTVMKAIIESSQKGNKMASVAMTTISEYLKNIHETQEKLRDLLQETTTTIELLAYMLAPVVSGVAVGMSQTIITAMTNLGAAFSGIQSDVGGSEGAGMGGAGILKNIDSAISPEILQLVVGIYLVQLLHVLGTFYMKIQHGQNESYRNMFIGKVLITGMTLFTITVILVSVIFGGLISGISAT